MNLLSKVAIALLIPAVAAALRLPFHEETSRRTAVSRLIGSSAAVAAASGGASVLAPAAPANAAANAADSVTRVTLNSKNKKKFPLASFGPQVYDDETAYKLTLTALEVGYRNFFASVLAGNQKGFARAISLSLSLYNMPASATNSGTVLSNRANGEQAAYKKTKQGCLENMSAMAFGNVDKLDMIMLDYPGPNDDSVRGQWRAFEEMASVDKTVDDLAVSNFSPSQLDVILNGGGTKPTVNQLPYSVAYHPAGMVDYNAKRGILVQSWSPLSRVLPRYGNALDAVGKKYGKSAAQVGLRWIVQSGAGFCTQSKKRSHFEEDLDVFDFELSEREMESVGQLAAAGVL
ncbi:hypothetical protein ACHAWF_015244 [Thalassiosira exigua]